MDEKEESHAKPKLLVWPHIRNFPGLLKSCAANKVAGPVRYRAKIKIHGCNCAVLLTQHAFRIQSRHHLLPALQAGSRLCELAYAGDTPQYLSSLFQRGSLLSPAPFTQISIFGEWAGKGVQKFVAVSEVEPFFAVFGIVVDIKDEPPIFISDPVVIAQFLDSAPGRPAQMYVVPWLCDIGMRDNFVFEMDGMASQEAVLGPLVQTVDANDPWAEKTFGVRGPGEGVVLYPLQQGQSDVSWCLKAFESLAFKCKGPTHLGPKQKLADKDKQFKGLTAEQLALVETEVTRERVLQAMEAVDATGKRDTRKVADWVLGDIEREALVEIPNEILKVIAGRACCLFHNELRAK